MEKQNKIKSTINIMLNFFVIIYFCIMIILTTNYLILFSENFSIILKLVLSIAYVIGVMCILIKITMIDWSPL